MSGRERESESGVGSVSVCVCVCVCGGSKVNIEGCHHIMMTIFYFETDTDHQGLFFPLRPGFIYVFFDHQVSVN